MARDQQGQLSFLLAKRGPAIGENGAAGRSAELAFTVEEDFQSRGIGSLLMRHIIAIARVKGLDRLEADVLPRNRPMLNVFRRCGLPMAVRHEGDVIHGVAVTEIIERGYGKTFYFNDPNGIRLQIEVKTKEDVDSLEGDPDPVPYVHALLQRA